MVSLLNLMSKYSFREKYCELKVLFCIIFIDND